MYELQEDGTHTLYNVKYDEDENEIDREEISKGHKLVWINMLFVLKILLTI
jgi:hypothetical protein